METKFEKRNHTLAIEVFDSFIKVRTFLSSDLYFQVVVKSQSKGPQKYDYERFILNDFKNHIFNEPYDGKNDFTFSSELYDFMKKRGIEIEDNNNNGWFNTVCFDLRNGKTKEQILEYIKGKSNSFEKQTYKIPN